MPGEVSAPLQVSGRALHCPSEPCCSRAAPHLLPAFLHLPAHQNHSPQTASVPTWEMSPWHWPWVPSSGMLQHSPQPLQAWWTPICKPAQTSSSLPPQPGFISSAPPAKHLANEGQIIAGCCANTAPPVLELTQGIGQTLFTMGLQG